MSQNQIFRGPNRAILRHAGSPGFPGCTDYILHSTVIVKVWDDGFVTLNSGGFRTATTKTAMNQVLNENGIPLQVFQRDGSWFVSHPLEGLVFEDGMKLTTMKERKVA